MTQDENNKLVCNNNNNNNNNNNKKKHSTTLSTYILQDDTNEQHFIRFDPTIQAFRYHSSNQRPRIVCDACGLPGYPANKCF